LRKQSSQGVSGHSDELTKILSNARALAGITQQQLAEAANLSIGTVRKIESGLSPEPGFFVVARIASALSGELRAAKPEESRTFDRAMQRMLLRAITAR